MKCMIEASLALQAGQPITGTSTTCATPPRHGPTVNDHHETEDADTDDDHDAARLTIHIYL